MNPRLTPARAPGAASAPAPLTMLGVRHDRRAWVCFVLLTVVLLAVAPMAGSATAQVPELPDGVPGGGGDDEDGDDGEGEGDGADGPDEEGDPDSGGQPAADTGTELKTAYYTAPTSDALPRTLTAEFPPGVACILFPDACSQDARALTGPVAEALVAGVAGADAVTADAQQPVPPGTLPVGILSGNQRYASALDIPLPPVGDNQLFGELLVTLQMTDHAFALESPAFRELVNAILIQATPESGPEPFEQLLSDIAGGQVDTFTTDFPGLEMCVIKSPWDAGASQPAEVQPEIDPLFCSPVAKPAEDGTVTFDMTFAANDSLPDGFVPGWEGVLVRPLGSPNLAFGDPDYSTNYIAYLDNPDEFPPTITSAVVDGPPPPSSGTSGDGGTGGTGSGATGGSGGSSGSGSSGGSSGSGRSGSSGGSGGSNASGSAGSPSSGSGSAAAPAASQAPASEEASAEDGDEPLAAAADDGQDVGGAEEQLLDSAPVDVGSSGWIPWLLLPMVLGGALWYGRVLDAAPLEQVTRAGAMTRLLQQRGYQV